MNEALSHGPSNAGESSAVARKSLLGNGYQLVCQFSSPALLAVQTGKGLFY